MKRYPEAAVWDEVAYLAYHLNWGLDDLLDLEHRQRMALIARVTQIARHQHETSSPSR